MSSQLTIIIEAMELLISPGNRNILSKESSSVDELDFLIENSYDEFCDKLRKDTKFHILNTFYSRRQSHYFSSDSSLKWKFASTCLILIEALLLTLQDLSRSEKGRKVSEEAAPSDILSIKQQKTFSTTLQFIIYLGVYPYYAKGVGIPLQQRSDYGSLLLCCKPEAKSILERQFKLLLVARVFSVCLNQTSLGSLLLSRHLADCLAVIFQLCYGIKKYPTAKRLTELENNIDMAKLSFNDINESFLSRNIDHRDFFLSKMPVESVEKSASVESCIPIELKNEPNHIIVTVQDIEFCQKILEKLTNGSYQPSLVKELVFLQGVPTPTYLKKLKENNPDVKFASPNFSPTPQWLKSACSQNLTKVLLKPNGVLYIVQGMLDASISDLKNPIDNDKICEGISKVIANIPSIDLKVDDYYCSILPQVNALLNCNDDMSRQYLHIAWSTMNIISKQQPKIFEKYCLRNIFAPLYTCSEYLHKETTLQGASIINESEFSKSLLKCHLIFVVSCEPHSDFLTLLKQFIHVIFCLFCWDEAPIDVKKLSEELLLTYFKSLDDKSAVLCLKSFIFSITNKNSQFKVPLMHNSLAFVIGSNGNVGVVFDGYRTGQCDFFSEDSNMNNLMDLLDKIKPNKLSENLFIDMLQDLTQMLTSNSVNEISEEMDKNNPDSNSESFSDSSDEIFYQLTLLTVIAAIYEKQDFSSSSNNTKYVLEFIKAALIKSCCKDNEKDSECIFTNEILTMSLGLLTAIVAGALEMSDEERKTMRTFIPLLHNVITSIPNQSIKAMASSLRIAIATYGTVWPDMDSTIKLANEQTSKISDPVRSNNKLIQVVENSSNELSRSISSEDSPQTKVNKKQLCEPESNSASSKMNDNLAECGNISDKKSNHLPENNLESSRNVSEEKSQNSSDLQVALKETYDPLVPVQGHGLIVLRRLIQNRDKETIKKHNLILHIFEEKLTHPDSYIYLSAVNGLSAMADCFPDKVVPRLIALFQDPESEIHNAEVVSSELKIKLGECLVKVTQRLGEIVVKFKSILLNAFLNGAKDNDFLVRASSLSNLGEVCKLLRFSLGNVIYEIFSCCSSLAKHDSSAEVRAASVLLITLLLQGLGKDVFVLLEDVLKDLYKLLKSIESEEHNETVKLQTNLALNELNDLVKDSLFPKQVLTKRIHVLDPP
ncbi:transport and Golgi organization protein 6 homolog [Argonauta hians]